MSTFKVWMRAATTAEQEQLAQAIGTSRGVLYQISGGFKQVSAARGAAMETEIAKMHAETDGRLPIVRRTELVEACKQCAYAQACIGADSEGGQID